MKNSIAMLPMLAVLLCEKKSKVEATFFYIFYIYIFCVVFFAAKAFNVLYYI